MRNSAALLPRALFPAVLSCAALLATSLPSQAEKSGAKPGGSAQGAGKKPAKKDVDLSELRRVSGQGSGAGKVLGFPSSRDGASSKSSGGLVIGRRRPQASKKPGRKSAPTTAPGDGELAMADLVEALGSVKTFADAELVAEYSLLSAGERKRLIARAHRLSNRAVTRLSRIWRALPERDAAPALITILKSRKLGKDTARVVDDLFFLLGPDAKLVALDSLSSPSKVLRSTVVARLPKILQVEDLPRVRALLDHRDQGVRISALHALAECLDEFRSEPLDTLAACLRHVDGAVRARAANLLAERSSRAARALAPYVEGDPEGPEWFLASLLLARRELIAGESLLPVGALRRLGRTRYDARLLRRTVSSVVAGLRLFGQPATLRDRKSGFADLSPAEIVDGLIAQTDVSRYYAELGVCNDAAMLALRLLTGEDFAGDHRRWSTWWKRARPNFVPFSKELAFDAATVGDARVAVREADRELYVFLGAKAEDTGAVYADALLVRLEDAAMLEMLEKLQARGLFDLEQRFAESRDVGEARSIEVSCAAGRARDAFPGVQSLRYETLERVLREVVDREAWQRYCPADLTGAKRRAWWVEQQRRFAEAGTADARRKHEFELLLRVLGQLDTRERPRALASLLEESKGDAPQLGARAAHALGELVRSKTAKLSDDERAAAFETLARIPEAPTAQVLDALAAQPMMHVSNNLAQILAVRGVDALLLALGHEASKIRAAAAADASRFRDPRVAAAVIAALRDTDWDVRRRAVESVGRMRNETARSEIVRLMQDDEPLVRHASMLALARVGGKGAFEALLRATGPGKAGDRLAAVRGLGMLEEDRAASALVGIAAAHLGQALGLQALRGLENRSNPMLRAEVRRWLESSDDLVLRERFTFLLGEMGDVSVVPSLIGMVERGKSGRAACTVLAQITGLDHCARADRVARYRKWIEAVGDEPLPVRLLHALSESELEHGVEAALAPDAPRFALVDELARLVVETPDASWPIRTLAAHTLREVTGQDFGMVRRGTRMGVRRGISERYRQFVRSKAEKR